MKKKNKFIFFAFITTLILLGVYFKRTKIFSGSTVNFSENNQSDKNVAEQPVPQKKERNINKIGNEETLLKNQDLSCSDCNVIIISLTNTRKDHIGLYGYEKDATPNIDKFFENSLIFKNAFGPTSWTLPNSISINTSLFPYSHKVMSRYTSNKLDDNVLTFAEILKQNGYATAAITGDGDYNRKYGISQGFDEYVDKDSYKDYGIGSGPEYNQLPYRSTKDTLPVAVEWLKGNKAKKKFLLFQGYDTHCPFMPESPFDEKFDPGYQSNVDYSTCLWTFKQTEPSFDENGQKYWMLKTFVKDANKPDDVKMTERELQHMIARYDGAIAEADERMQQIFSLLESEKLTDNSIIIFMSEHGDLFGEHGRFMRGGPLSGTFYDPVLNFPFVMRHPKIKTPVAINTLAQAVDIMPTLLDMLDIKDDQSSSRQGKDLIPAITKGENKNDFVYAGSRFYSNSDNKYAQGLSEAESIRNENWKLMREKTFGVYLDLENDNQKINSLMSIGEKKIAPLSENYELYDIKNDPLEKNNIYSEKKDIASNLLAKLKIWENKFK
jgi:choline-sulfatase